MKIVLANGCFDIFHIGHLWHLKAARKLGDRLIVSLTVDNCVNKGPGRPLFTWEERAELLKGLRCVNQVIPSTSGAEAILKVKPDIFVKGVDYLTNPDIKHAERACKKVGAKLKILRTRKLSSTDIYDRLRGS